MPLGPAAQSALLGWINTFPISSKVESWAELSDGSILSEALGVFDSSYKLLSPSDLDKLQAIVNGLFRYIRTECNGLVPWLDTLGLKEVPEGSNASAAIEVPSSIYDLSQHIVVILLMAAVTGRHRQKYITSITKLDPGVQGEIAKVIQQKQHEIDQASTTSSGSQEPRASPSNDYELEFEVRYSSLIAHKKKLEEDRDQLRKQLADSTTRLERLSTNNNSLQLRLTAAEDGLSKVAKNEDDAKVIKSLEAKVREQDELIASQESQIEQGRTEKMTTRNELQRLATASDLVFQLQDENKELQYQNLELTKKANTVERYKQKLESLRALERDIRTLEQRNEELETISKTVGDLRLRNETLEAIHAKFQDTLSKREVEIFELSSQKQTLDKDKKDLQHEVDGLVRANATCETTIQELKDQLSAAPYVDTGSHTDSVTNLGVELDNNISSGAMASLEISRLRTENQFLKGNAGAAREAEALRIELETAQGRTEREMSKNNELLEKNIILTRQVSAILDASTAEGLVKGVDAAMLLGKLEMLTPEYHSTEVISNLRELSTAASEKVSKAERKARELERNLEDSNRQLLKANAVLTMITKNDVEALEELRETQEKLTFSYEAELKKLRTRLKDLDIDFEQQKSQLIDALVSKNKLQQIISGTEDKAADRKAVMEDVNDVLKQSSLQIQTLVEVSQCNRLPIEMDSSAQPLSNHLKRALNGTAMVADFKMPSGPVPKWALKNTTDAATQTLRNEESEFCKEFNKELVLLGNGPSIISPSVPMPASLSPVYIKNRKSSTIGSQPLIPLRLMSTAPVNHRNNAAQGRSGGSRPPALAISGNFEKNFSHNPKTLQRLSSFGNLFRKSN